MANIHTISINNELEQFLQENPELSPSKVMQAALYNIKDNTVELKIKIKVLQNKISVMQARIFQLEDEKKKNKE